MEGVGKGSQQAVNTELHQRSEWGQKCSLGSAGPGVHSGARLHPFSHRPACARSMHACVCVCTQARTCACVLGGGGLRATAKSIRGSHDQNLILEGSAFFHRENIRGEEKLDHVGGS